MLRVVQLGVLLDPQRSPSQMMNDWWAMVDTAEMVARAGAEVVVVQASRVAETVQQGEVTYHFLVPQAGRTLCGSGRFAQLLAKLTPDVVHVHGLGFAQELLDLAQCLPDTPILVQDHADGVPGIWRRRRHRRALAAVSGLAFCALGQAEPFRRSGMIAPGTRLFEIPECSSRFTPGDQDGARGITGMSMGGYGALRFAFAYPQLFSAVSAHSAALVAEPPRASSHGTREGSPLAGMLGALFGNPIDAAFWNANSPFVLARRNAAAFAGLKIYFDCGSEDSFGFDQGARDLHEELDALKVKHEFHIYPGSHGVDYFLAHAAASVDFHSRVFQNAR